MCSSVPWGAVTLGYHAENNIERLLCCSRPLASAPLPTELMFDAQLRPPPPPSMPSAQAVWSECHGGEPVFAFGDIKEAPTPVRVRPIYPLAGCPLSDVSK